MNPDEIQRILKEKGIKQTQLATALGVSDQMIHLVIHGRADSRRIMKRIARIIDYHVSDLWPHFEYLQEPKGSKTWNTL